MPTQKTNSGPTYSQPYKCMGCNSIVAFEHLPNADPKKDAWRCTTPSCHYIYKSRFWKLRKQTATIKNDKELGTKIAKQKETKERKRLIGIPTFNDVWESRRNSRQ